MKRTLSDLINNSDTKDLVIKNVNTNFIKESPTQARKKFDQTKLEECSPLGHDRELRNLLWEQSVELVNL